MANTTGLCGPDQPPNENFIKWSGQSCAFVYAIICSLFGLLSNSATIYVISVRHSIRSHAIVVLILYLSISDLGISILGSPIQAARFYKLSKCIKGQTCDMPWPLGKFISPYLTI